jgi:hypothetical protein
MLYYTSFLILLPIFYGEGTFLGRLYTLLLGISVLNHAKKKDTYPGKQTVETIDKIIVYAIACTQIYYAIIYRNQTEYHFILTLFWCCFIYVIYNYHIKRRSIINSKKSDNHDNHDIETQLVINHVLFHITCTVGGLIIMYCIKNANMNQI